MTRTLCQKPSGLYTVNNLGATDWDHVLSNFSTLANMLTPPCSFSVLAGCRCSAWIDPGGLSVGYASAAGNWGNCAPLQSPGNYGNYGSVLMTDGSGDTFWSDLGCVTVPLANYANSAGTWGCLSPPCGQGCGNMLLVSNGCGGTQWADSICFAFGNAAQWDGLCAPCSSPGFLYNDGCGHLCWAGSSNISPGILSCGSWNELLYDNGCGPAWLPSGSCGMVLAVGQCGVMGWTDSSCLSYVPSGCGRWSDSPPSTLHEALDRLSSAIYCLSCAEFP